MKKLVIKKTAFFFVVAFAATLVFVGCGDLPKGGTILVTNESSLVAMVTVLKPLSLTEEAAKNHTT